MALDFLTCGIIVILYLTGTQAQREKCPYEVDFPSTVVLRGRTVGCSPTPPDYSCEWNEDWYFACHNVKVDDLYFVSRDPYNSTLDSSFADLCLDMLFEIGEGLGRSAIARIDESTQGTIRYTNTGDWFVLAENGEPATENSYFRVACQTSSVYKGSHSENSVRIPKHKNQH